MVKIEQFLVKFNDVLKIFHSSDKEDTYNFWEVVKI